MKLSVYGAARQVTGSNFLIETDNNERFLIDCGLFQGGQAMEAKNARQFPYRPSDIDFMILTHAHIDHSGRIPYLVKEGFNGPIYTTKATADLAELMLYDSAKIQESDAEWQSRKNQRQNKGEVEPLYMESDVTRSLPLLRPQAYGQVIKLTENLSLRFRDAGHILGSSILEIWVKEGDKQSKLVVSGDLGMSKHILIRDPEFIEEADYLIMESTYGNSVHASYENSLKELMQVIEETTSRGGTVLIPSFAVGRTQELIYEMNKYYEYIHQGQSNPVRIIVDSPMATKATGIFMKNTEVLSDEAQDLIRHGDNVFAFPNLSFTANVEESVALNTDQDPKVIIASSGMATGGRIRHHLKHHLWQSNNAVIFVGYQAEGSLGRIILDGAQYVKILGEDIACRAKVYDMKGFSAHADQPMLLDWLDHFSHKPKKVILVHGEDREMMPLAKKIEGRNLKVYRPHEGETIDLAALDTSEAAPTFAKQEDIAKHLNDRLAEVQDLMRDWEGRKVDLETVNPESLGDLETALARLKSQIMDLNVLTGK